MSDLDVPQLLTLRCRGVNSLYDLRSPGTQTGATIPANEMKKLQTPHPLICWDGYSPLTTCGIQFDVLEAIDRSRHAAFINGTQFDWIITVPGATPDVLARIRAQLVSEHGGPDKARGRSRGRRRAAAGSRDARSFRSAAAIGWDWPRRLGGGQGRTSGPDHNR